MSLLATVLAAIGALVSVIAAVEHVLGALARLIRAGIPVTTALRDLRAAVRRVKKSDDR